MNLESKKVNVSKSADYIFNFLLKLENYEQLMPENLEKFEIDGESFIFGLKGMPQIRLVLKESTPNTNVTLGAASSKLPFTLGADLVSLNENNTEVQLKFEGDFNPMMSMMVKKPLTKFIETLADNLEKL